MSDAPQGPGWWQASDDRWYPPQQASGTPPPPNAPGAPFGTGYGVPYTPGPGHLGTNTKATVSLVLGIVGLFLCGLFTGIPAIVVGSMAKKEIEATGGRQEGRGLATAGQVMGWISTVLSVLGIVAFVALIALGSETLDDINSDPPDGICNEERFLQDPDC